jgi:hypothetical protein
VAEEGATVAVELAELEVLEQGAVFQLQGQPFQLQSVLEQRDQQALTKVVLTDQTQFFQV